jgi:hypothetical protein
MRKEGAHITVPPLLGSCATKSKANSFTFLVKNNQGHSTEEAPMRMPMWHLTVQWFIAKGMRHGAVHPRMCLMTKPARHFYPQKVGSRSTVWLSATILPPLSTSNESHGTNAIIIWTMCPVCVISWLICTNCGGKISPGSFLVGHTCRCTESVTENLSLLAQASLLCW